MQEKHPLRPAREDGAETIEWRHFSNMTEQQDFYEITRDLPDEAATVALGRELSLFVKPGDWLLLSGPLGAGKSTLARALIHALAPEHGAFEVPSPTFTLVQPYDFTRIPVAHVDLYRIADPYEVDELGLEDLARTHLMLVEWPDRLERLPADRLEIALSDDVAAGRSARLVGHGAWAERLARMERARQLVERFAKGRKIERRFLQGDASARRYERLVEEGRAAGILMDMPERPDGPPIRDSRSYDEIAHLARSARAVWAVNTVLAERGFSAPRILAEDLRNGLLVLEDLGDAVYGRLYAEGVMEEPLAAAVDVLAAMAAQSWPKAIETPAGEHVIAPYDEEAFLIEAELLLDWFWPFVKGTPADEAAKAQYRKLWTYVLPLAQAGAPVWCLRDYHSPNLIWLPERKGLARVGLIDTQDAVLGPAAYDLASLLQDARVSIPQALEEAMLQRYFTLRRQQEAGFDEEAFRAAYAVMGAQRAAKVLGIFVRLKLRDGKPGYLRHLPRVKGLLARNLAHPALGDLRAWMEQNLPEAITPEKSAEGNGA